MQRIVLLGRMGLLGLALAICLDAVGLCEGGAPRPAPDFPTRDPALWLNSKPLSMADLKGKVVLLDVWTYG